MRTLVASFCHVALLVALARGQDYFPAPIPLSDLAVGIEDFAIIPDSSIRQPPRLSVLTRDPLGRLFVNDQRGPLYTIDDRGETVSEYLDIRDFGELRIISTSEAGFQSFAFHPDFANPGTDGYGRFYTIHSTNNTTTTADFDPGGGVAFHTVLLEWHTDTPESSTFLPAESSLPYRELLRFKQPFGNHNAGLIAFNTTAAAGDPDYGNLYVALADGGSAGDPQNNGQDPSNPFGAVLRINPLASDGINGQYGIVSDNALAADNDPQTLGEIFAYGLRNPQRFGWDEATGNLFIADIGQSAVEEIDMAANGANFGWNDREGSFRYDSNRTEGYTNPVAEYDHTRPVADLPTSISNRAVTLGEVARGTGIPGLDGQLMISDFPTGLIFLLDVDHDPLDGGQDGLRELAPLNAAQQPVRILELINASRADRGLSSVTRADVRFGINTPGEVFITNKQDGIVRRLVSLEARTGDCNRNGLLDAGDLACVTTLDARDAVLDALNALPGDLDGDGAVGFADFTRLAGNFLKEPASYGDGNIDLMDGVDFADFQVLATNFAQVPSPSAAVWEASTVVAEPGASAPLGIVLCIVFRSRHARRRRR